MKKKVNGFYILGTGRSGTTMTNRLLASHPDVAGVMQVEGLRYFSYKYDGVDELIDVFAQGKNEAKVVKDYFKKNVEYTKVSDTNPFEFMHDYCCAHADFHKKTVYSEKSPIHSLYVEEILENIPNSKVIVILRDPRATFYSKNYALTANRGKIYNFPKFAREILNLSEILFIYNYFDRMYHKYVNSKRVLFVRYEDIVTEPKKTFTRIFKFMGLKYYPVNEKFKPNDLRLVERGEDKNSANSSFKDIKKKSKSKNVLSANSVRRWEDFLSINEVKRINSAFAKSAPTIAKIYYPEILNSKNLLTNFRIGLSKIDKFIYIRKNIGEPSKVNIYKK